MKRKRTDARAVLIVDDNVDIAATMAELLRARGHTVEVANDAATALDVVQHFHPSVALLDIGLPTIDGYELARRLRQQSGLEELTLLAMTGALKPADQARARRAGFAAHFAKPFDVDRLIAAVEDCRRRS